MVRGFIVRGSRPLFGKRLYLDVAGVHNLAVGPTNNVVNVVVMVVVGLGCKSYCEVIVVAMVVAMHVVWVVALRARMLLVDFLLL